MRARWFTGSWHSIAGFARDVFDGAAGFEASAIATGVFGDVESRIRAAENFADVSFVDGGTECADTDAASEVNLSRICLEGSETNRIEQVVDSLSITLNLEIGTEDEELLSAVAAYEVIGADGRVESLSGVTDDVIASKVSVLVVDELEVIEVGYEEASPSKASRL